MEGDSMITKAWAEHIATTNGSPELHSGHEPFKTGMDPSINGQDSFASAQSLANGIVLDALNTPATSEAGSVARLQQNLQRLYGSFGQMNGSKSSLPDILEEETEAAAAAAAAAASSFLQHGARVASEEDLFRLDGLAGGIPAMQPVSPQDMAAAAQMTESRTLFIRGVDPQMADETLKEYFECFGDIHSLYTASKHRGYVMVTYHDIRAARLAQHTVHGQAWRGRALACSFSQPSDAAGGTGTMATLLLISLDGGRSMEDAFYILSAYGELRELRKDPSRPNYCTAEFYDDRHAANALKSIASTPELSSRLLALDAAAAAAQLGNGSGNGASAAAAPTNLNQSPSSQGMATRLAGSMQGSSTQLDGSLLMSNPSQVGMHQAHGMGGSVLDFNSMTRTLSEMSLESAPGAHGMSGMGGGVAGMSAGDLMSHMGGSVNRPVYPLRGIASTGSMWPGQAGNSLGNSPVGTGVWPSQMQDVFAQQQQQQHVAAATAALHQQTAMLQHQQAQHQQAAVHAALQQALLSQRVAAAAAMGMHPPSADVIGGLPRRNFSEPTLGGRLARRPMDPMAEAERRVQQERLYGLDMQRIAAGEDKRTTLMVKNIPNKYTQKMLLTLLEERFAGVVPFPFDFFYLPIDFKNRCNVGYAFINMTSPAAIPALVEEFHGRRWPKFNSEKVCRIAYARIQGKLALVQHFQNSSLLHEDKRCRPVLFTHGGDVEVFPVVGLPGMPPSASTSTPLAAALAPPSSVTTGTPTSDVEA